MTSRSSNLQKHFYTPIFCLILTVGALLEVSNAQTNSLTNGLVAYYPFNGNPNDATGNGYNAYISNDTQGVSSGASNNCLLGTNRFGLSNSAYKFTGQLGTVPSGFFPANKAVSSWMTISNSSTLMSGLTNWSISTIVKINAPGDYYNSQFILDNCKDYSGYGLSFGISSGDGLVPGAGSKFFVGSWNGSAGSVHVAAPYNILLGSYYYVTATYSNGIASVYVNSSLVTQTNISLPFPVNNPLSIGRHVAGPIANPPGYGGSLNGVLDEIRIYNRALSSNEVSALYTSTSTYFPFTINSDRTSVTVTGYRGPGGSVTIPSTINGLPVTAIAESAFAGQSNITSISIPDGVTSIGSSAFSGCTGLTGITLPDSVISMGMNVFAGCPNLTNVSTSNGLKTFLSQYASELGLSAVAVNNFYSTTESQLYAMVATSLAGNDLTPKLGHIKTEVRMVLVG